MSREVVKKIMLRIPAGQAKPAPPVGTALGGAGVNIMGFCKDFNAQTQNYLDGVPVPVEITAYKDRSFTYTMRTPPVSYFLLKAAGLDKGANSPGHEVAGYLSLKHIYEIAKVKQSDPSLKRHLPLKSWVSQIIASCRSMGIEVVPRPEDIPKKKKK
ncbi:mitochondrial ribosomal protein L11 [Chloropicon primus]|uniref:Large ribosomal subunit protein uL11m n=2 Tax=Chloropicon primus TaxID=1764295 RepID=A0A5B8ME14_9CHLO|nr:mitochondrial ribosomal protein L11 [Chloropicon primus]UPQ97100.1 mitochondrial ribosomal protein L11 [Chloropicon primus]|eukprot:QDZ17885.1 mitochondrial ribosomal protein L11 [Chloropicon primus]